jgi:hypothetical protein
MPNPNNQSHCITTMPSTRLIKHLPELDFTIVAVTYEYRVDFKIYEVIGWAEGATLGVYDVPEFYTTENDRLTESIQEAELYLHGEVKWDGCSNWHFDEQDRVMLHGCARQDVLRFGEVMAACWDWAAEIFGPSWFG